MIRKEIKDVVIIGAGITGLTTGFYLKKGKKSIAILEQKSRVGGQINSLNKNGFCYEQGPNNGTISNAEVAEFFEDLEVTHLVETASRASKNRLIWKGESFKSLPSGLVSAVATPLFTLKDKFRILAEPFRPKIDRDDETLAELVKRRLGESFLDYAVDPFISGIYAGDPNLLVTKYAMPKLYNLEKEYGSFVGGAIKKSKEKKSQRDKKASKELFSFSGGLSTLINSVAEKIGAKNIYLESSNIKIDRFGDFWRVGYTQQGQEKEIICKDIVTTVEPFNLISMFENVEIDFSSLLQQKYAPVVQVSVGVSRCDSSKFNAFGGLVPTKEKRDVLGILFPSICFNDRAPEGGMLFSFFMGGVKKPQIYNLSDEEIKEVVIKECSEMLGINSEDISLVEVSKHLHAIAQYEKEHGDVVKSVKEIESDNRGVYIGGSVVDGIGLPNRIKQGRDIAKRILMS